MAAPFQQQPPYYGQPFQQQQQPFQQQQPQQYFGQQQQQPPPPQMFYMQQPPPPYSAPSDGSYAPAPYYPMAPAPAAPAPPMAAAAAGYYAPQPQPQQHQMGGGGETHEELVRRLLGTSEYANSARYIKPNIPEKKQRNAIRKSKAPADTDVWVLLDATVFGSADNSLIVTPTGLYCHNDWSGKTSGAHHVSWHDFMRSDLKTDGSFSIHIGCGSYWDIAGSGLKLVVVQRMLRDLQRGLYARQDLLAACK